MEAQKKQKQYRFGTFGPFKLPVLPNGQLARDQLDAFWKGVETVQRGLPDALGCYVFGIRTSSGFLPWYVGKTEKKSFRFEAVQPTKLLHYQEAIGEQPDGEALLFLLPRLTDAGNFRKVWRAGSTSVARLEGLLIGTALERNPNLRNRAMIKHLTQTIVPGYMNDSTGKRTLSSEALAEMLGKADKARSLSLTAADVLTNSLQSVEAEVGAAFLTKNRTAAVFSFRGADYRVILEPHSDNPPKKRQEKS